MRSNLFIQIIAATIVFLISCDDNNPKNDCQTEEDIIVSPNTDNNLESNNSFEVSWNICYTGNINIQLFNADSYVSTIATNIANSGAYTWEVGSFPSDNNYQLILTDDASNTIVSSDYFAISFTIEQEPFTEFTEEELIVGEKTIKLFTGGQGEITLVFEHGAGAWQGSCLTNEVYFANQLLGQLTDSIKFIAYNRAGYFSSTNGELRGMEQITSDLDAIINQKVDTDKLILVGHSWGGHIIRYYAINHPDKVDALLFIDPDHEDATDLNCCLTQTDENNLVNYCINNNCLGCEEEYKQLIETIELMKTLPNLPDIPTRVISGTHGQFGAGWVESHANLGDGLSDFEQVICNCPHEIPEANPEIVFFQIRELINRINNN